MAVDWLKLGVRTKSFMFMSVNVYCIYSFQISV